MKKTKIVATIGPATESVKMLEKLLLAGMDVMRLNFSHGDFEEHGHRVNNLKEAMKLTSKRAAILQDLSGPKIRIGEFANDSIELVEGQTFTLTTDEIKGDSERVHINYPNLPKEVSIGHIIYIQDGKKKLKVIEVRGNQVICEVLVGGKLGGKKGVNLPDSELTISCLTEKDRKDIEFGIKNDVDFFALSFVRKPEDIDELREIILSKGSKAKIIAKIETPQAVKFIDEILLKADGIMVARGDLAIEVPTEKVPMIQKTIIKKCNDLGKPCITATQMLESMIKSPVPTRAEVSDVANAIIDGTDAIMLSEETTLGEYPVEAVKVMSKIAREIESNYPERPVVHSPLNGASAVTDSITSSVVEIAHNIGAKAIIAMTGSGFTARMISRHRPKAPIFALSSNEKTVNQMCLSFGCRSIVINDWKTVQEAFEIVRSICLQDKIAKKGERVVIAAGAFSSENRETNMVLVETI